MGSALRLVNSQQPSVCAPRSHLHHCGKPNSKSWPNQCTIVFLIISLLLNIIAISAYPTGTELSSVSLELRTKSLGSTADTHTPQMAKEESKYGFKDRAKAEESLELLKSEDPKYQQLTVRGLIGRAKRVLTLTKADDKVANIKAAIETFEQWLEANGTASSTKNAKPKDSEEKVETVPGLGFKDKQAAEQTLKILEDRDPDYQKLAIKGLLGSAKRVLPATKNPEKLKSIKEAIALFNDFLDQFDREERGKQNMPYLPIELIRQLPKPKDHADSLAEEFLNCYQTVAKGNFKHLRTKAPTSSDSDADPKPTWDIIRNRKLRELKPDSSVKLFDSDGKPTERHLQLIQWAYSPQVDKLKSFAAKQPAKAEPSRNDRKRSRASSSSDEETSGKGRDTESTKDARKKLKK